MMNFPQCNGEENIHVTDFFQMNSLISHTEYMMNDTEHVVKSMTSELLSNHSTI